MTGALDFGDPTGCPCGMPRGDWSSDWHRRHRDLHLSVFPNVDVGTRWNLADFIVQALTRENNP